MKRTNKKGFTIVELVIVIAVIAILAAVLIPNISKLVRKANESNDVSLAKNMNTLLTMDEAENGKATNMYDVLIALENGGFKLSTLNPRASGNVFAWDKANNQIVYLSKDKILFQAKEVKDKGDLYITTRDADTFETFPGYSFYLVQDLKADVTLSEGSNLDTGEFTLNGNVSCKTDKDVDVDIRGKINGTLTVDSDKGTITNYSIVNEVVIVDTAPTSYHERGQVKTFTIDNTLTGKVVFENDAYVETLNQNNTTGTVDNSGYIKTIGGNAKKKVENPADYALEIRTFEELCNFRDKVNAGATYEGMTVRLMADIDISSRAWTPIGAASRNNLDNQPVFRGIFDGNNKTISGLTNTGFRIFPIYAASNTTTPKDYKEYVFGLFGSVINAEIKNLNMAKVNIDLVCDNVNKVLGDSVGAIAGFAGGTTCTITNCHVLSGKINGFDATAGIIGRVHTKTAEGNPGETVISNCSNAATVTSSRRAAGILGYTNHDSNGVSIKNCENKANITCLNNEDALGIEDSDRNTNEAYHRVAGIVNSGNDTKKDQMSENSNSGNIKNQSTLTGAKEAKLYNFGATAQ